MLSDDAGLYKRIAKLEEINKEIVDENKRLREKLEVHRANEEHWRNLYGKQR